MYPRSVRARLPSPSCWPPGTVGSSLSRDHRACTRAGAPLPVAGLFEAGIPVLGIWLRLQAMGCLLGETWSPRSGANTVALKAGSPARAISSPVLPEGSGLVTVWMSHGGTVLKPPPDSPLSLATRTARSPRWPTNTVDFTRCSSTRVAIRRRARRSREFPRSLGVSRSWSRASFIDTTVDGIRERVGNDRVLCALSRRWTPPSSPCSSIRAIGEQPLRVRRRGCSQGRGGSRPFTHSAHNFKMNSCMWMIKRFWTFTGGSSIPRSSARELGRVHRLSSRRGEEARTYSWGAGNALSGCDRVRVVQGPVGDDQDPSQRGGCREEDGVRARRTLSEWSRTGAPRRRDPRPAPEVVWRQPFRGRGLAIRVLGDVTRERARRAARRRHDRAGRGPRGRARTRALAGVSQCCCRSTPSASWAILELTPVVALRAGHEPGRDDGPTGRLPYDLLARISTGSSTEGAGRPTASSTTFRRNRHPRSRELDRFQ